MFGKTVNGELIVAPNPLKIGNRDVFTNDPAVFAQHGYLPVVYTSPEQRIGYYVSGYEWTEQNGEIVQVWIYAEDEELSAQDALAIIVEGE